MESLHHCWSSKQTDKELESIFYIYRKLIIVSVIAVSLAKKSRDTHMFLYVDNLAKMTGALLISQGFWYNLDNWGFFKVETYFYVSNEIIPCHLLNEKMLLKPPWQRSAIKEINDWVYYLPKYSSEIRGLHSNFCLMEMLQNLLCLCKKKTHV